MHLVELKNVTKQFRDVIFQDVNMSFPKNGLYVLYGKSGSGKSTLLNIMANFDTPDKGEAVLNYDSFSYMMQSDMLFYNLTVEENLLIKLNITTISKEQFESIILGICTFLGVDHLLKEQVSLLSGGEKQRVSLARALIEPTELLLLDEPTSNLDEIKRNQILTYLKNISKSTLIIISSHDPAIKDFADRVFYLEDGDIRG